MSVCLFVCLSVTLFLPIISPQNINGSSRNFQARPTGNQQTIFHPYQPSKPYPTLPYHPKLPYPKLPMISPLILDISSPNFLHMPILTQQTNCSPYQPPKPYPTLPSTLLPYS